LHKIWCTLAVPLSDPSRNRIRPDIWLQRNGCTRKYQHVYPAAWNFALWLPSCSTSTYHLPFHCAITAAVQAAAPVPETMDTTSYSS
jgi:hypothetical protein